MFAVQVVGQDQALDLVGFEVAVQQLLQAAGQEAGQLGDLAAVQPLETTADADDLQQAGQAGGLGFGRGFEEERLQVARQRLQFVIELKERVGIGFTEAGKLRVGAVPVAPPGQNLGTPKVSDGFRRGRTAPWGKEATHRAPGPGSPLYIYIYIYIYIKCRCVHILYISKYRLNEACLAGLSLLL